MLDKTSAGSETNGSGAQWDSDGPDEDGSLELMAEAPQQDVAESLDLTQVGNQVSRTGKKNTDSAAFIRVIWVPVLLIVLAVLTVLGIIVGLNADQDSAFGKFCMIAAVPLLSIAIGFFGNRFFHDLSARETLRKDVQMAAYTTYHLQSSVVYVDERVGYALDHLLNGSVENALLNLVSAKTATELSFGMAQQSASQLEMISPSGASAAKNVFTANHEDARPKIIPGNEPKVASQVANDEH